MLTAKVLPIEGCFRVKTPIIRLSSARKEYRMNVLMLLKPKSEVEYLVDTYTIRQGLEKMKIHGYTAIPVISKDGEYLGSVSEGDFLWFIVNNNDKIDGIKKCENYNVCDIINKELNPAVNIDVSMEALVERAEHQNYIPVVDDRGYFIGIVTRKTIINTFCDYENVNYLQHASVNNNML